MNPIEPIAAALQRAQRILVASHRSPEGDALGSSIALTLGLRSLGKQVTAFNADPVPRSLCFLPRLDVLQRSYAPSYDAVVFCDCAEPERVSAGIVAAVQAPVWIVIDHHCTAVSFGTHCWQDAQAPATSELVLHLLRALGVALTRDMAVCLYTGLLVDTGSFRFSNATERAFRAAADLVAAGAGSSEIATALYENQPLARLKLLRAALGTLEQALDGRLVWITVDRTMLESVGATLEDIEGLVNYPRSLAGCDVAAQFTHLVPGNVRVSLRTSRSHVDVELVARRFGGGGHKHAAGFSLACGLADAKRLVIEAVASMLGEKDPWTESYSSTSPQA